MKGKEWRGKVEGDVVLDWREGKGKSVGLWGDEMGEVERIGCEGVGMEGGGCCEGKELWGME